VGQIRPSNGGMTICETRMAVRPKGVMSINGVFNEWAYPNIGPRRYCRGTSNKKTRVGAALAQRVGPISLVGLEPVGERVEFLQGVLEQRARGSSNADIARLDCRE
jgi:hypothetical protein